MDHRFCPEKGLMASPVDPHVLSPNRTDRLRLWEIDPYFRCPVVGMCLSLSEQKRLLKKVGIRVRQKTPFRVHEVMVISTDKENELSKKADTLMNHKYAFDVNRLMELDEEAFVEQWKMDVEAGDVAGALWTAATRRDLSVETRREVFGAVHMAMHWTGKEMADLTRQVARFRAESDDLKVKNSTIRSESKALRRENGRLMSMHEEMRARLLALEEDRARLETECRKWKEGNRVTELERNVTALEAEKSDLLGRERKTRSRMETLEKECALLGEALEREREAFERLKAETEEFMGDLARMNRCEPSCPSFDLCRKRILIVGGLKRMEELYRRFIETSGGVFEYHDGYVKRGIRTLENRFMRADVVLCPVSCNSHAACTVVKNMGKRHNKPVHFLFNSSLNAVSQALA